MTKPTATVIGWPISHSLSPSIHGTWLAEHGLDGDYRAVAVEPGKVGEHFERIRSGELVGSNVTVPHKEAAFTAVDRRLSAAEATGAVNTVWMEGNELVGTNTDPAGFLGNLDAGAPGWDGAPGRAVVLGAGGAARGIASALAERGFAPVSVANRTLERAETLARDLSGRIEAVAWNELPAVLGDAQLLVNATSLGMTGQPPLEIDLGPLASGCVVTDSVYVPLETPLLAQARGRGNRVVDGLGMLLHQAVPGFAKWFGVTPEVTPDLRRKVLETLSHRP